MNGDAAGALAAYRPRDAAEAAAVAGARAVAALADPWARSEPRHLTASALVVDPATGRVLLRWHDRMRAWMQVGGHGDPGERDPFAVARREAVEETGLDDLVAFPDPARPELVHVAVVDVPAGKGEPAHHHVDLRYVLATGRPEAVTAESAATPLRWMTPDDAVAATAEDNVAETIRRVAALLAVG